MTVAQDRHQAPPRTGATPSTGAALRAVVAGGLWRQRRAVLAWGLPLGAFGAFMAAIYPSIRDALTSVVERYPPGLKEAFGVSTLATVEGYVHAELFSLIVPLAMAYFAIRSVSRPTVGAEEQGELDTTLSLPISRTVLVAGSYAVTLLLAAGVLALLGAMIWVAGRLAGTGISLGLVAAGCAGVWPLALFAGGLALLTAGFTHRATTVTGVAIGSLVAMYGLDVAGRLAPRLDAIRWASAFRYYGAPLRDGLDVAGFAELTAAGLVLAAIGAWGFARRDLRR